ncbi:unnamed protein product [Caenorhabditis auriculariae]|uniref:CIP2A N-terminal domain-containing protein n=1 Tax=Caenorhabditis auriculariae TaxID=2777116 RepID=A0A8S1H8K9_9PELO|nr:unnamed protein product [Caenorhabditis auriculariae]
MAKGAASLNNSFSDAEAVFSRASTSAARYVTDSSTDNTAQLDESLMEVIRFLSTTQNTARLSLKTRLLVELLNYTPIILTASTTNATTRSRFHRLLFNIGLYNVELRKYMARELEMCSAVFHCLKVSLREQLGPQNMIDILRMLQVLSYEKGVTLGVWTNELISFLMSEVVREPEEEWMPYCMAILCNLASRSKSVCNRIKKSTSYKPFSRRIMALLVHDSRIVVLSALVLIGYLEEKNSKHGLLLPEHPRDFSMCFQRFDNRGHGMRLVVSDVPTVSSTPVLASTGKDIMNYGFFERCIQHTAELLVVLDPRLEESTKIYDLLLAFCSLSVLKPDVCAAIIKLSPTESRLTTPLHAIANTSAMSFEEAINPEVPLKALSLLSHLIKEIIDTRDRVVPYVSVEQLVSLVDSCVTSVIDPAKEDVAFTCRRVQLGLRLAEVCSQDEDVRNQLLPVTDAQLCSSIADYQLIRNPIVCHLSKPPLHRDESLPKWSVNGVGILLELSKLLASLKDHSRMHKEQYWRLLKDERLVPFLAYAIAHGDHEMVLNALVTFIHCSQVHVFPTKLLAELVASCSLEKRIRHGSTETASCQLSEENRVNRSSSPDVKFNLLRSTEDLSLKPPPNLDELLKRISQGFDVKDMRVSEVLSAYERKIAFIESREKDLEALVAAKDQALAQSEKLRIQYRNGAPHSSETDISQVRSIMQDCEGLRETNEQLNKKFEDTRRKLEDQVLLLRDELARTRQERESLTLEMEQERALVLAARTTADDLKRKLEIASASVVEKQNEIVVLNREKLELTGIVSILKSDAVAAAKTNAKEIERLHGDVAQKVATIEKIMRDKTDVQQKLEGRELECAALRDQVSQGESKLATKEKEIERLVMLISRLETKYAAKERECVEHSAELDSMRSKGQKTQADLDRMRRLREEMLRLADNYE